MEGREGNGDGDEKLHGGFFINAFSEIENKSKIFKGWK